MVIGVILNGFSTSMDSFEFNRSASEGAGVSDRREDKSRESERREDKGMDRTGSRNLAARLFVIRVMRVGCQSFGGEVTGGGFA